MIHDFIALLLLVIFSAVLQRNFKIPAPVVIMATVIGLKFANYEIFTLSNSDFDSLVIITLPLLIATDALKIQWADIKQHGFSLFWVSVVIVVLSVGAGVLINDYIIHDYTLTTAGVVMLFCMVSATDPITVSAVFSNFKVPHKLKILTEGESLFNDATALIIFSIALLSLKDPTHITYGFIIQKSVMVIGGAVIIGIVIGYITVFAMKLSDDPFVEATVLLCSAYTAYLAAEHYHFSGILAVIVTILMANVAMSKVDTVHNSKYIFSYAITSDENKVIIHKSVEFVALFASSVLFISVASIVDFAKLYFYRYEIFAIFGASTVIRAIMMLKFAVISNLVTKMQSIYGHWWAVLTFAGSKGALSILMVHMLPSTFEHKELFENIIVGNILLSTFVYAGMLAGIILKNKARFSAECELETHH